MTASQCGGHPTCSQDLGSTCIGADDLDVQDRKGFDHIGTPRTCCKELLLQVRSLVCWAGIPSAIFTRIDDTLDGSCFQLPQPVKIADPKACRGIELDESQHFFDRRLSSCHLKGKLQPLSTMIVFKLRPLSEILQEAKLAS